MTTRRVTLGDLFRVGSSKRVLKSQWRSKGVPFYRGREITRLSVDGSVDNELFISEEDYAEYAAMHGVPGPGDIMVTAIGTIGNSYIVQESDKFYFKDASVLWMKRMSDVSSRYVDLWLKSPQFFKQLDNGNGATVDTLTIRKLKSLQLEVPPLPEQERIVATLDEAFAARATAVANTETNLSNARELYESELARVFSEAGEGWEVRTLGELYEIARGGSPRPIKKYLTDAPDGVNWIKIGDATASSKYIYSTKEKIKPEGVKRSRLVHEGDFLLSNSMSFGRPYIMKTSGCIHDGWLVLRDKSTKVDQDYLYHFLGSNAAYRQFELRAAGAIVRNLNIGLVADVEIPVPPAVEQERIVARLEKLSSSVQSLVNISDRKLRLLAELKQSILHKAFTGELTAYGKTTGQVLSEAGI